MGPWLDLMGLPLFNFCFSFFFLVWNRRRVSLLDWTWWAFLFSIFVSLFFLSSLLFLLFVSFLCLFFFVKKKQQQKTLFRGPSLSLSLSLLHVSLSNEPITQKKRFFNDPVTRRKCAFCGRKTSSLIPGRRIRSLFPGCDRWKWQKKTKNKKKKKEKET